MTHIKVPARLLKFLKEGLISKGEHGELVARLLLTLAHDRAAVTLSNNAVLRGHVGSPGRKLQPAEVQYSRAIPLITFLRELIGEQHLQTILQSMPDNVTSGVTFEEAFKDVRVHFTRFAKAGDSSAVSDNAAWKAMCRGIAFQCFDRQTDIDFAIAILMNYGDKLCGYNMSTMLVQIKNGAKNSQFISTPKSSASFPPTQQRRARGLILR